MIYSNYWEKTIISSHSLEMKTLYQYLILIRIRKNFGASAINENSIWLDFTSEIE